MVPAAGDVRAALRCFVEAMLAAGEPVAEVRRRLGEHCAQEGIPEADRLAVEGEVDALVAAAHERAEVRTAIAAPSADVDGIRQTLREHANLPLALGVSLLTTLVATSGFVLWAVSSGRFFALLWLIVVGLSTAAVRAAGRCIDGPIRGVHALAMGAGFLLYHAGALLVLLTRELQAPWTEVLATQWRFVAVATVVSLKPFAWVVLASSLVWAYRFSVISLGDDAIARARALQERHPLPPTPRDPASPY